LPFSGWSDEHGGKVLSLSKDHFNAKKGTINISMDALF
jgi:hypothetical protein